MRSFLNPTGTVTFKNCAITLGSPVALIVHAVPGRSAKLYAPGHCQGPKACLFRDLRLALGAELTLIALQTLLSSLALLTCTELLHLGLAGFRSRMFFRGHPTLSWSLGLGLHTSSGEQGSEQQ